MSVIRLIHTPHTSCIEVCYAVKADGPFLYLCHLSSHRMLGALDALWHDYVSWDATRYVAEDPLLFEIAHGEKSESLSEEASRLIHDIHSRLVSLQRLGVNLRTVREALLQYQAPSRIQVKSDNRILLQDYADMEVPLTPLCKALYLFFLQHPEGVTLKQMSCYRDELLVLYQRFAPGINPQRRQSHIDSLVSPLSNSLHEKLSLIRRTFSHLLDESLLPFYVITGQKGGVYSLQHVAPSC
ncbi:MAG: hypothetical protein MJZ60_01715 [Bacteroidaceae bacterium]|nr:hypothetical protein [Bacteroidaceae bacterium]